MKVLHIVTQMEAGGAQGAAVRLTDRMLKDGIQSKVCFLYTKRDVYVENPNCFSLCSKSNPNPIDYLVIFYRLLCYLVNSKTTHVVTYTHYANIMGCFAALLAGIKIRVASQRSCLDLYPRVAAILDYLFGMFRVYTSNIIVSNSAFDSFSHRVGLYTKNLRVIHNGINFQEAVLGKYEARETFGLPQNKIIAVTTGRLHPSKNQISLIEAMKDVEGVVLVVAGGGENLESFKAKIARDMLQDKVILLGEIKPSSIPVLLSSADCFLFASKTESFGFSVVEAMGSKLPVLVSDIPAMKEVVGDCGLYSQVDNVNEWSEKINQLVRTDSILKEWSDKSYARSQLFSFDSMYESYIRVLGL